MTFKEWLDAAVEDEIADAEHEEDLEEYRSARRRWRKINMINALAAFFPDLPELEGRVLLGATSY